VAATKIPDRFPRRIPAAAGRCLKRLRVDHVDLVTCTVWGQADDLAKIEAPDGAMKGALEARDQKMTAVHRDDQSYQ